jgi:hypothetical protein
MATTDGVSKWPEKQDASAFSEGRIGSTSGASGSRSQRDGEPAGGVIVKEP